ncbi:glycosyltransferase family 4 protein [Actinokineospora iranica]|uniref:UDP-GlcNAc:undecaprenyl-phosphate GlcNAc-1-phosphate transferase n=1 Tax=Actinokineospora iranica TaxID=1271860 RepID=A0A1G6M5V8_9PSEU|nr:MraY family glycosyltransferase [Actinokineospora iranica]SDC50942.1 UDP-GlcNAc:undecaprenyl-phosphate GlcNAc-1-phosphate transferase [Actinokineospora iranica]
MTPTSGFAPAGLPVREYLLVALITAVLTFLLTGLVRLLAIRMGAVAYPRQRDVHVVPMPRLGGLAMYLGICGGMLLAHQLPVLRRAFDYSFDPAAVLIGGGIIVGIGMLDDRFELDSLTKLAGQTTCAGILVLFGIQWFVLWVPWGGDEGVFGSVLILDQNQGGLLAILLAVTMINAMNFVDGLDGLAAGIGLITAAATCVFSMHLLDESGGDVGNYSPALITATLAGACLGFLPHNFQPARIFMGDSGSMLIGLMLAAASTTVSFRGNPTLWGATDALAVFSPLLIVAAVLFVPVLDLMMAVIRRTRRGESPFSADKMHLHHRLLEIGHSQRRAVLLIYLWAGLIAFGAIAVTLYDVSIVIWGIVIVVVLTAVISYLPRIRSSR